ncbi:thiamine-monophosphate kinase, partial [uncultured Bilophila sp.]
MSDLVSEDHVLARIASHFPNEGPDVLLGRGDDCAVLGVSGPLCVSTDMFMEDVHFRRAYFTPEDIGWKALAVNLSDLAASGARPAGFTLGLALPPGADMAFVDGLCAGMAALAAEASAPLVGGDLSRAEKIHLCATVFGQAEKTLLRGEAQAGDVIFLIGRLGLARTGLMLLEERGRDALADWPAPCNAHLRP